MKLIDQQKVEDMIMHKIEVLSDLNATINIDTVVGVANNILQEISCMEGIYLTESEYYRIMRKNQCLKD